MQGHAAVVLFDAARDLRFVRKLAPVPVQIRVKLSALILRDALLEQRKRLSPEIGCAETIAVRLRDFGKKTVLEQIAERLLEREILHFGIQDRGAVKLRARHQRARAIGNIKQDQLVFGFTVCKVWHFIPP